MSTIENTQIWVYFYFNKIKGAGTSSQYPALSQKHVRNVFNTAQKYFNKFHFAGIYDSKEISLSITSIMKKCQ